MDNDLNTKEYVTHFNTSSSGFPLSFGRSHRRGSRSPRSRRGHRPDRQGSHGGFSEAAGNFRQPAYHRNHHQRLDRGCLLLRCDYLSAHRNLVCHVSCNTGFRPSFLDGHHLRSRVLPACEVRLPRHHRHGEEAFRPHRRVSEEGSGTTRPSSRPRRRPTR